MPAKGATKSAKIVKLQSSDLKTSEKKWGLAVMQQGYSIIPSLLFKAQQRLGINPTQLAIIVQLADYWWDADRKPYPSKKTLSERLGISPRQLQRHIAELEDAGLVRRIQRTGSHRGKLSNEYDLSGLVARLAKLEPEFRETEEEVKSLRRQVKRRGGRRLQKSN
jgi:DNA-binding MarR family transcriptional regulator